MMKMEFEMQEKLSFDEKITISKKIRCLKNHKLKFFFQSIFLENISTIQLTTRNERSALLLFTFLTPTYIC